MGFESSHMARRRLATLAMSNTRVQDALAVTSATPGEPKAPYAVATPDFGPSSASTADDGRALAVELEALAQDIANTPGAGGALLATYAEQARVLELVAQAAARSPGAPLPFDVLTAVRAAVAGVRTGRWDATHPEH